MRALQVVSHLLFSGLLAWAVTPVLARAADSLNLITDGSFEETMPKDQFGLVFRHWGGWKYEGDCEFRVGQISRSGKSSCLLFASSKAKIRVAQTIKGMPPGRYRLTAHLRGLDLGPGIYRFSTELAVNGEYMPLKLTGSFGWTAVSYLVDIPENRDVDVAFGLWGSGYLWIDDVSFCISTGAEPLTPEPLIGKEESPVAPPAELGAHPATCLDCGYRNRGDARRCYACGAELLHASDAPAAGPQMKLLASFEKANPFDGGTLGTEHATEGAQALKLEKSYASWSGSQDWSGFQYLKADVHVNGNVPLPLSIEIVDAQTRDYWTRVNYETLVAPGDSTLVLPLDQLFVGEKARPGRQLELGRITRLVLNIGDNPGSPLFLDNLRLERDNDPALQPFDGLHAYSFGPASGPLMPGFVRVNPSTLYSKGRGYGLRDARVWRAQDVLQPDPLYQKFMCIENGGFTVDLPNGRYHVFLNIDNPSGFWGEYQSFRHRIVLAQGQPVVDESMNFESLKQKYFRYWQMEDLPSENTFDAYQVPYYHEKQFDVDVRDGQLVLGFEGEAAACSVSALVIYPQASAEAGKAFLAAVVRKRRFFFDNYFHRILHAPTGDPLDPSPQQQRQGYCVFARDFMQDVYANDTPRATEVNPRLSTEGFVGEDVPLTVSLHPLMDLGQVKAQISDLAGPQGIPASAVSVGYVSYRLTRVSADGSVYTITPRMIIPREQVRVEKDVNRTFWLTIHVPDVKPDVYRGAINLTPERGEPASVPVSLRVFPGTLDPLDLPVGPYSHEITIPWDSNDPATIQWNQMMEERTLRKLHDTGFTTFTGIPHVTYLGFKDGKPLFDFTTADRQMNLARQCGFTMPVISYTDLPGLNLYEKDGAAMKAAGFDDYSQFIKAVFGAIQAHADSAKWLPVYWNICDEPVGDAVAVAADNAEAYRKAFPQGPPYFTGATSFDSGKADDPHLRLAQALGIADINGHNEPSVRMLQQRGGKWGFYNGGNRWTYGTYLYKASKQFDVQFRLTWHWNAAAGDPYYPLDCREDDFAWCNSNPQGELIPSVFFARDMCQGITDYRYILTMARLAREKSDGPARELISQRLSLFHLGQREHDEVLPTADWIAFRTQFGEAIARLRAN